MNKLSTLHFAVLVLAGILAIIGFGSLGIIAYLKWKAGAGIVYFVTLAIGFVMLGIALSPAYKMYKINERARK